MLMQSLIFQNPAVKYIIGSVVYHNISVHSSQFKAELL